MTITSEKPLGFGIYFLGVLGAINFFAYVFGITVFFLDYFEILL